MCGIVGYVGHRPCGDMLIDGLRRLEYRGYDSAGVAIHDGSDIVRLRAEGKLMQLEQLYRSSPPLGTTGVAHTRWATHGSPIERNAHPHQVGRIVLMHNGIIKNYAELRDELAADGAVFSSDTDTEIVAHLIDRARPGAKSLHAAVLDALKRVRGSYAFVVLDVEQPDELVVARNASPLVLGVGQDEMFAASDVPAIMSHTRDVIFLEDGDTAVLKRGTFEVFDTDAQPVERTPKRILWDPVSAEKQGYKHFMLKEIHEQPTCVVDTLRGRLDAMTDQVVLPEVDLDPETVRGLTRMHIVACGTSWHAGLIGKYVIEKLARLPVEVDYASEYRYRDPVVDEHTLALAISQSGETADTLAAIRHAKSGGAKALAICNVMESTIARETRGTIYTHAGPEIGVASTKAYTTQLTALYLLGLWLGRQRGTLSAAEEARITGQLRLIPGLVEDAIGVEDRIRDFARDYAHTTGFLFLGRGPQFPNALEGALKLKEISYIHAEGYASGEMKHGPIALIDEDLPVVVLAPKDPWYEKVVSNVEEVKARGGRLIVITTAGNREFDRMAEHVIEVPDADPLLMPLITAVPLQLLAYCIADARGTDIDQPRNLAKSVTVE